MSLWGTLKKEGQLLGDISGISTVAHSVEHPLDWKNDLKTALVIGSYAMGGGAVARSAASLAERLTASRAMEAAPAEVGGALHAAWGTPTGENPIKALLTKLGKNRPAGNGALGPLPPTPTETKGMFFHHIPSRMGRGATYLPGHAHQSDNAADALTQAFEKTGDYTALSEPYNLSTAASKGGVVVHDRANPLFGARNTVVSSPGAREARLSRIIQDDMSSGGLANPMSALRAMGYTDTSIRGMHLSPVEIVKWLAKYKKAIEDGLLTDSEGAPSPIPFPPKLAAAIGYPIAGYAGGKTIYDKVRH